ncbi:hypothetical protein LHYA1_G004718 [Lachnellula hyalina]|uniref:Uncharacterized protein n=1 Tax=Lachnellula hyalina TaxID=1316788 RepID=A0A8H8TYK7_9HELO|nr:uncharacterized protein LHYA1_G004718 [Lachnellula hyalina]TVY26742.1 hypothetical protein LHYA1_G004718 [Lachnellula hyalina]
MSSNFGKAHKSLNGAPSPHSTKLQTAGFYRNGLCDVGKEDTGNHSIAATLTDPFLDFSASRGNNLRSIGLSAGCKWCLCASRWKEALDFANSSSESGDVAKADIVPKVHLHATHERALDVVDMKDLRAHAAESEAANASSVAQDTGGGKNRLGSLGVKERTEMAGKGDMTSRE